ncbi:MAG: hypothetical protein COA79_02785 [Planctomycetota bacterium]|nr:MAG: hypothetical protein COA79_02785 [Planctomycetota bacterium]
MRNQIKLFMILNLIVIFSGLNLFGKVKKKQPKVEIVFVLDTTGSMSSLIQTAKNKIWSIANTMAMAKPSPSIKMGILGYRDRNDKYITVQTELTDDLDKIYKKLMSFSANGGGDTPESVNQALHEAVLKNNWDSSLDTYKVIFLVGDAPPHMDYSNDVKYQETCKLALKKGIIINTIQCGSMSGTAKHWQEIAKLGEGSYLSIAQSGGSTIYKTPYDSEINKLSQKMDASRLYYGKQKELDEGNKRKDISSSISKESSSSSFAQRACYNISSAGKKNYLGSKELVNDVSNGKINLDTLAEKELPAELKKVKKSERKGYVLKLSKERNELEKKILKLTKKRQQHIQKQVVDKKGDKNSFDQKVFKCIQSQAKGKKLDLKEMKY